MSFARNYGSQGGTLHDERWSSFNKNNRNRGMNMNKNCNYIHNCNHSNLFEFSGRHREHINNGSGYVNCPSGEPPSKRRKFNAGTWKDGGRYFPKPSMYEITAPSTYYNSSIPPIRGNAFNAGTWEDQGRYYMQPNTYESAAPSTYNNSIIHPSRGNAEPSTSNSNKRGHSKLEEDRPVFMSRDEIEKYSPSRKDGIDALHETHLRYSYCAFIQNLGMRLELPQTTIGTAMVLCHRFFLRRSHACHDRYLTATAALFLAAKSEETPRPLNNVLRVSSEIFHKQDVAYLMYLLPVDWFEQYWERVIEAEQMILTTLNFELSVQHPYDPLTSVLGKLGLSQTVLVNLALNLVSEGLRSSLWLQFKPHHIAAGAAYLAARFLNLNLAFYQNVWQEFRTTPSIVQEVAQQLIELFL